jgi:hypothetical protein
VTPKTKLKPGQPGSIIHFKNRQTEGVGRVVDTSLGWPVVETRDGERTALNPGLNEIRFATSRERVLYYETPLQELYRHLEHAVLGNVHMAFYGQLRAHGRSHHQALNETIKHFRLEDEEWYRTRMSRDS